jgi:hypothetical protein
MTGFGNKDSIENNIEVTKWYFPNSEKSRSINIEDLLGTFRRWSIFNLLNYHSEVN